jgi:hypothetical protein
MRRDNPDMTSILGVTVGAVSTSAAVWRDGQVRPVRLGSAAEVPTVVYLDDDGTLLVGEGADDLAVGDPGRAARTFAGRIGEGAVIPLGGRRFSPEQIVAAVIAEVAELAAQVTGERPERLVLTCPAVWDEPKRAALGRAAGKGWAAVEVVTEAAAVAAGHAARRRLRPGATVAVFDLGATSVDAAVVRVTSRGAEVVGLPLRDEGFGGVDLDRAAVGAAVPAADLAGLDDAGAARRRAGADLAGLDDAGAARRRAGAAVWRAAAAAGRDAGGALSRARFDELTRDHIEAAVGLLEEAVAGSGVRRDRLDGVVLTGGASRTPLAGELAAARLGVPLITSARPELAASIGAAVLGALHRPPGPAQEAPDAEAAPAEVERAAATGSGTGAMAAGPLADGPLADDAGAAGGPGVHDLDGQPPEQPRPAGAHGPGPRPPYPPSPAPLQPPPGGRDTWAPPPGPPIPGPLPGGPVTPGAATGGWAPPPPGTSPHPRGAPQPSGPDGVGGWVPLRDPGPARDGEGAGGTRSSVRPLGVPMWLRWTAVVLAVVLAGTGVATRLGRAGARDDTRPRVAAPATTAAPAPGKVATAGQAPAALNPGRWAALPPAPAAFEAAASAVLDGRIWIAGGLDNRHAPTAAVWVFDPATLTWGKGPELPAPLTHASLAFDGDTLLLIGGYRRDSAATALSTVLRLDRTRRTWVPAPSLPIAVGAGAAAWDGARVVFAGGVTADMQPSDYVVIFEQGRWRKLRARLSAAREHLGAASDGRGTVWFTGGEVVRGTTRTPSSTVDLVGGDQVVRAGRLPTGRGAVAAFWPSGTTACAVGGRDAEGAPLAAVECVDASGTTTTLPPLPDRTLGMNAAVIGGRLYVVGGLTPGTIAVDGGWALPLTG